MRRLGEGGLKIGLIHEGRGEVVLVVVRQSVLVVVRQPADYLVNPGLHAALTLGLGDVEGVHDGEAHLEDARCEMSATETSPAILPRALVK